MASGIGFKLGPEGYAPLRREITKAEEALLIRIFHASGAGKKGYLSRQDLKVAVVELFGYKPTKYEADQILAQYGEDIGHSVVGIPLEKFVVCMSEKLAQRDEDEEIRHAFMAFDVQCHGFLTVEDLKRAFSNVAPHMSAQSIHSAFRGLDQDCDGRVSYKDFEFLMKYNTDDHF